MPPPSRTPGLVHRPKFAGLNARVKAPISPTLNLTPTGSSQASDVTASPTTQPPPKPAPAADGGDVAATAALGDSDASPQTVQGQPPAAEGTHHTTSTNGRNVQFAAPASPTTAMTPATTNTPSSAEFAAAFSKGPPGGIVPAPHGLGGKHPAAGSHHHNQRVAAGIAAVAARHGGHHSHRPGHHHTNHQAHGGTGGGTGQHVRMQRVGALDETQKASLHVVYLWEDNRNDWSLIVEKQIRSEPKARKEREQHDLGCNHPNLVRYLFCKEHRDPFGLSVFMEFVNLGSLRTLMESWEHHDHNDRVKLQQLLRQREREQLLQDGGVDPASPGTATTLMSNPSASFGAGASLTASQINRFIVPAMEEPSSTMAVAGSAEAASSGSPMGSPMGSIDRSTSAGFTPQHTATCLSADPASTGLTFTPGCHRAPTVAERVLVARCVGKQVLQGLHYYHIVHNRFHRDVKPGNILVKDDGRVKLCDFDAYKNAAESGVTMDGTACYLPPEIARGESQTVNGKCDVWAAGIVLFEIVFGRHPFAGVPAMKLVREFTSLVDALPWSNIPHAGLRDLIKGCMQVCPGQRFTCEEAATHAFFTTAIPQLFESDEGASEELLEDARCVLGRVKFEKDTTVSEKALDRMRQYGIEVGEDAPALELTTWKKARMTLPPGSSATATEKELKTHRRQTDDVMKRIVHVRQHPEHEALASILRNLGHTPKEYTKPSGPPPPATDTSSAASSSPR